MDAFLWLIIALAALSATLKLFSGASDIANYPRVRQLVDFIALGAVVLSTILAGAKGGSELTEKNPSCGAIWGVIIALAVSLALCCLVTVMIRRENAKKKAGDSAYKHECECPCAQCKEAAAIHTPDLCSCGCIYCTPKTLKTFAWVRRMFNEPQDQQPTT